MRISDWSSDVCSSDLSQQQGIVVGQGAKLDHHLGQRGRNGREARSQRGDVRQPAFVKVLGEKIGKLGIAGPFMGHGQQLEHLSASVTDRKRDVWVKSVSVRVDLGGHWRVKKKI